MFKMEDSEEQTDYTGRDCSFIYTVYFSLIYKTTLGIYRSFIKVRIYLLKLIS